MQAYDNMKYFWNSYYARCKSFTVTYIATPTAARVPTFYSTNKHVTYIDKSKIVVLLLEESVSVEKI